MTWHLSTYFIYERKISRYEYDQYWVPESAIFNAHTKRSFILKKWNMVKKDIHVSLEYLEYQSFWKKAVSSCQASRSNFKGGGGGCPSFPVLHHSHFTSVSCSLGHIRNVIIGVSTGRRVNYIAPSSSVCQVWL